VDNNNPKKHKVIDIMKCAHRVIQASLSAALLAFCLPAMSHEITSGALTIGHPWVRATAKGVSLTAGYVRITNTGKEADKLIGASLDGAGKGELHTTIMEGDVMKMRPLPDGVAIKPGETVEFKPSGNHIMFMDLSKSLSEDTYEKGTLVFEKAGKVDVEFSVQASADGEHDHSGHEHATPEHSGHEHHH
jgi:copper(I)-binding protein